MKAPSTVLQHCGVAHLIKVFPFFFYHVAILLLGQKYAKSKQCIWCMNFIFFIVVEITII